jgi:hypothetical protein
VVGDKFLTGEDQLVVVLRVKNTGTAARVVEVLPVLDWQGPYEGRVISGRLDAQREAPHGPWAFWAQGADRLMGFDVVKRMRFAAASLPARAQDVTESRNLTVARAGGPEDNATFFRRAFDFRYALEPGETKVFKAAVEFRLPEEPSTLDAVLSPPSTFTRVLEANTARLGTISPERQDLRDPLAAHREASARWLDANLATFECSEPLVSKMYLHRAHVLRRNGMDPRLGAMLWPTQSEGRWRSTWYPHVISYGAGHQVREARWLADPRYAAGHVRTWAYNAKADGVYPSHVTPKGPAGGQYTDWITSTAWDVHLVHPDPGLLSELAEKLAANVRGWQATCDPDGDGLLRVDSHWWTGMEFQPSFFAFGDFRLSADGMNPEVPETLDRVDLTSYNFGNARNLARIYRALGQADRAKEFEALAAKIRSAVAAKMWSKEDRFFLSLRASDGAAARVKEVVGVYPFYFGMFEPSAGFGAAWASILDPEEFWTPWPVASASKKTPAYSQTGWPQAEGRRVAACMWNGPTWPHANSLVLTAMARTIRGDRGAKEGEASPLTREKLWELFLSFTKAQYRGQDPAFPWTGEYYDGEDAVWVTDERDYNHSTYLDVLIPDVVGLVPREDAVLEVDPLVPSGALSRFLLDGQRYHGRWVSVVWDAPGDGDDAYEDTREGLEVHVDGALVHRRDDLGPLRVDLETGKAVP